MLHVAQYLFGSAACPILYFTKVKQQRWPAEEHCVYLFIFVKRVKEGERLLQLLLRGKHIFF